MKNWYLILVFFFCTGNSLAQKIGLLNYDSTERQITSPDIKDSTFLSVLSKAEKYIVSILGSQVVDTNIWLDLYSSQRITLPIYSNNHLQYKVLKQDPCYDLGFIVKDHSNTIGAFNLLINGNGELIKSEYYKEHNYPYLIKRFKKYFNNEIKITLQKALDIGKKRNFIYSPHLECEIENGFYTNSKNEEFVKIRYFWRFFTIDPNKGSATLEINATTGKIDLEEYAPSMPK